MNPRRVLGGIDRNKARRAVNIATGVGKVSKGKADAEAGVSDMTGKQCENVAGVPVEIEEAYLKAARERQEDITAKGLLNYARRLQRHDDQREADRRARAAAATIVSSQIVVGDFREKASVIPDASVDLVFTDPPYDRASVPLYEAAAKEAARVLKPGGSMICYTGQYLLPDLLPQMGRHLRFWWLCAVHHGGAKARMTEYGIVVHWKPLMWFVKETRGDKLTFVDDIIQGDREKSHHAWQQAESEAAYWIDCLTDPGDLVVDFFCGGGTTPVVADRMERKWLTFEIDVEAAAKADGRISAQRQ